MFLNWGIIPKEVAVIKTKKPRKPDKMITARVIPIIINKDSF